MESSLKKQNLCAKENLYNENYEIPVENEFTIPENMPPIKRVINCKIEPAITTKGISGNMLSVDGVSGIKLIYLDNDEQLNSYETAFVFNKNADLVLDDTNKASLSTKIIDYRLDTDLKSDRKFVVKGIIEIGVSVTRITCFESLSGENTDDFELQTSKCTLSESILSAEKNIIIDDEIELSESHAQISKIINYYGKISPDECKIMNGKVMLKGTLTVSVTYMSEDTLCANHIEQKFPYSQVCDIDGIDDSYICKTDEELVFLEIKCRNGGYEDSRCMTVSAKIHVNVGAEKTTEKDIVLDIFSTNKQIEPEYRKIESQILIDSVKDSFTSKKTLEFSQGTFGSIIDMWADAKITGTKVDNSTITAFGVIHLKLIVCTEDNAVEFYERSIDFEYKYNTESNISNTVNEMHVDVNNLSYIISSNSTLEIVCDLNIMLNTYMRQNCNVVVDVAIVGENSNKKTCSVSICYLDNETDLWTIAKKYKSRIDDLIEINALSKDQKTVSGTLLIPVKS